MNALQSRQLRIYAVALLATITALLLTFALQSLLAQNLMLLFVAAVIISAWYGGLKAGLTASVLAVLATTYFFLEPKESLVIASANEVFQLIVFVFIAIAISSVTHARRHAQDRLSDSNEQLATILRGIDDGIMVQASDGQLIYANDVAAQIVGYPSAQALTDSPLNQLLLQLDLKNESGAPCSLSDWPGQRALHGETVAQTLLHFARQSHADESWVTVSASPIHDKQNHVQFVISILRDVSKQKRVERRLNAQYTLARILADTATLADATPKLLQTICESFNWEAGLLWVVERETDLLHCADYWSVPKPATRLDGPTFEEASRQQTFSRGIGLPGRVWASGEPDWIADVTQDTNFPRAPSAAAEGLHAALGFPIKLGNDILGVIEFFSHQIRQPDAEMLALMATIGSQIGQFIDRRRADEALRAAEVKYRTLVEQIPAITYIISLNEPSGITYLSPQYEAVVGFTREEWIQNTELRRSRIHPDDRERVLAEHKRTLASGEPFRCEYRLFAHDGRELWFHDEALIVRDEQGQPRYLQGVVFDISEQKRAEQALRELANARDRALAETKLLNDIAIAAAGEQNLNRILTTALLQLKEMIRFTGGSIALIEADELVIRAAFGPFSEIALGNRVKRGIAHSWQVIETNEPLMINEVTDDNAKPTTPIRAWLGVPLIWRGQTFGLLEIDSIGVASFTTTDVSLMQTVATVLSGSIELAQRYAAEVRALVEAEAMQWRLETVLRQMPSGVMIAEAPSGKIILSNEQTAKIWRQPVLPADDSSQYTQFRGFHLDGRPYEPTDWPLARSIAQGEIVTAEEVDFIRGDDTRGMLSISSAPIRNRRGDIIAGVVVFDDITERKQSEIALHESNSVLQAVFEGTTDAMFVKDLQGRYLMMNAAGAQMLNRTPAEVIGKSDRELFASESVGHIMAHDQHVMQSSETITYEDSSTAAGITRTYLSTKGPYRDAAGAIIGIIGISRDITERKRTEDNQRFLTEASRVLGSSLDYETTLKNVAQLAVRQLADWCSVHTVNDDNALQELVIAHHDATKEEQVRDLLRRFAPGVNAQHPIMQALRSGRAEVAPELSAPEQGEHAPRAEHLEFLRALGMSSHMAVPLILHGRTLGVMFFVSAQARRQYNPDDLRLAEALADRAAFAIENARLYRHTQKLNEQLEQRVLERTAEIEQANSNLEAEILERTQAEERIRRSEHQLAQAQQVAHVGSWQWDIQADMVSWSDELYRIYGLQPQAAINYEGYLEHVHPEDRELVNEAVEIASREHTPFSFDHRIVWPDGSIRTVYARGEVICDAQNNPIRMVGTGQDISERKHLENELRRLAGHLQTAREEERTRVAREIHDQLGQVLTAIKMDLTLLGRKFADGQRELARSVVLQDIKSMAQMIDHTIQSVREIITELRPEMLEDLGLKASIEWQLQEFETRTRIKYQFTSDVNEIDLDLERATAVFRILQEALTNIARHAHATQVQVLLKEEPAQLMLEVRDNGKGIRDSEMTKAKSFGILGMRERALLFGGKVDIEGSPGRGTILMVRIPQQNEPMNRPTQA